MINDATWDTHAYLTGKGFPTTPMAARRGWCTTTACTPTTWDTGWSHTPSSRRWPRIAPGWPSAPNMRRRSMSSWSNSKRSSAALKRFDEYIGRPSLPYTVTFPNGHTQRVRGKEALETLLDEHGEYYAQAGRSRDHRLGDFGEARQDAGHVSLFPLLPSPLLSFSLPHSLTHSLTSSCRKAPTSEHGGPGGAIF